MPGVASAAPSTHSREPTAPRCYPINPSASLLPTSDHDKACPMGHASTTGDTQEVPRTCQVLHKLHLPQNHVHLCLQPPADLTPSKVGPMPHTRSPANTQAAGAPSCATGLACHHIHTCMQPWGTIKIDNTPSKSFNTMIHVPRSA